MARLISRYRNLSIRNKALLLTGVPLTVWILFIVVLMFSIIESDKQLAREQLQIRILAGNLQLAKRVKDMVMSLAVYRLAPTTDLGIKIEKALELVDRDIQNLLNEKIAQQAGVSESLRKSALRDCLDAVEYCRKFKKAIDDPDSLEFAALDNDRMAINLLADTNKALLDSLPRMMDLQQTKLSSMQKEYEIHRVRTLEVIVAGVVLNSALGIFAIARFGRDVVLRINSVLDNSLRIIDDKALRPAEKGLDELSRLDQTIFSVALRLREATKRERAIVTHAHDLILILNKDLDVISANPSAQLLLGVTPPLPIDIKISDSGTLITRSLRPEKEANPAEGSSRNEFPSLILSPSPAQLANIIPKTPHSATPLVNFECTVSGFDGKPLILQIAMTWAIEISAWIAIARDVTEIRSLERTKQEIINVVSHDIRTPLTSMSISVAAMLEGYAGPMSDGVRESASGIQRSIDRLLGLVNDLLDASRLEGGNMELNLSTCDTEFLVLDSISSLEGLTKEKNLTLNCDELCCLETLADPIRLGQVLQNLVSNAIKFSPEGSTIEVCSKQIDNLIRFEVKDEGAGVPEESRPFLFDRFWQSQSSRAAYGTGLGLFICKLTVNMHGGEIGYLPGDSGGSIFWFHIPLRNTPHGE